MTNKRYFGFAEFGTWVRGQVTTLSEYLNLKLGEADTRLGEMDTKLLNKADQSALDLTNEAVATKANQNEVSDALDTKLDATATAVNSSKLEGSTKAQVVTEARTGLATTTQVAAKLDATATAINSSKLEGATKAQIILEAIAAANLDTKLDVTTRTEFATAAQGVKADTAVQPDVLQAALNTKLNASVYTAGDVLAKLLTVDGPNSGLDADALDGKQLATIEAEYKAFTNAAISALVDSSPDALNTLNELATALGNDPNFATTMTNQLASKVDKTDTRLTDAREWNAVTVTQAEAEAGIATTRRAWTAQRIRQAIAAWWAGSADKTKLDGIQAGAQVNVATNLGYTSAASSGTVTSSTGTNATLPAATTAAAGLLTSADKSKLDGIQAGAQVNVTTNLTYTTAASTGTVNSSTGTNATIPAATTAAAGLMTSTDKSKLDGIQAGAQVNVATNLGISGTGDTRSITSSTGTNVTVPIATSTNAGLMGIGDRTKLDGIAAGAQVNVATNLSWSATSTGGTVSSSTGGNAALTAATTALAGLMVAADKTKLDGISAGAQVNVPTNLGYTTGATAGTITSSTGTNASLPGATTAAAGLLSAADKAKLNGISAGATVNSTDAALLSRSNHTGTQAISTVSGLQAALDAKFSTSGGTVDGNITASTFYTGNWFRSTGATGWYSETYGGGIHMSDTTWVRVYGSKSFYVEGNIAATGEISGFYSDERLKENMTPIEGALESLRTITGYRYTANELAAGFGYDPLKPEVGFSAQEWQVVAPEIVELAPFDYDDDGEPNVSRSGEYYLTMKYHRTLPYVVMAINELADLADNDRSKLDQLVLSVEQIKVQLTELQSQLEK